MRFEFKSERKFNKDAGKQTFHPLVMWLKKSLFKYKRAIAENAPVGVTGDLRSRVFTVYDENKIEGRSGYLKGLSGEALKYAIYVEYGTRRHFVPFGKYPGFDRWARRVGKFDIKKGGGLMVGEDATHPSKNKFFMKKAVEKTTPQIRADLMSIKVS